MHEYQTDVVSFIIKTPFCGVFLDLGLGKTVTTLTAINDLMYDYLEINSVLVIAPKRVAESVWQEEAKNWEHLRHLTFSKIIGNQQQRIKALNKKADIHIISRDSIAWLCALCGGSKLPFDMIVVDELSSFKSYKSRRWKALKSAQPCFKRFVGLTGTPAPNSLIDLWPQIYLMDRGTRLGKTITAYRSMYFRPGKSNGSVVYSYDLLPESDRLIHEKISDICISMKSQDYLKLPERTDNFINLKMPDDLLHKYMSFEKDKVVELLEPEDGEEKEINAVNAAALCNKLLQFANGAIYDEDRNVYEVHDIKLEALKEIIDDANGKPVLVAWSFQHDRDRIMKYLKAYKPRELKKPQDIIDWNSGKVQVMLAHPASAGHGLNLQAGGNIIVWFGLTWSLELFQQFNARLYRQGQKNNVIIHYLVMKGTYDEEVIRALQRKDRRQSALMDSIKARIEKYSK